MGRRGLHTGTAIRALLLALFLAPAGVAAAACGGSDNERADDPSPTASSTGTTAASPSATPTRIPPTPTPDPIGTLPSAATDAAERLAKLIGPDGGCPPAVVARWSMECAESDLDGDGEQDWAYILPLEHASGLGSPGVVLAWRSGNASGALDRFPGTNEGDASAVGRSAFGITDVSGDGRPELHYLATLCTATGCKSRIEFQTWDGTAWRDIGPGDAGVDTVEDVAIDAGGEPATVAVHGGTLPPSAGPTRPVTVVYQFDGVRFAEQSRTPDATVYLIHAIQDADALFAAGEYHAATEAYAAAIANESLKDWKAEQGDTPGAGQPTAREHLEGYALLRIAIATAAAGNDPTAAIDAAVVEGKDEAFATAAQAFRRGLQQLGDLRGGCLEATRYLTTEPVPAYVARVFDYGPANPKVRAQDICPF